VALADESREAHRAAVHERHTPAPAEDAEDGTLRRNPQVAPERQLEPTRHRVAFDGGDGRLREQQA